MNDDDTTRTPFSAVIQADIRRERRLLYAEIAILLLLVALAALRYGVGR